MRTVFPANASLNRTEGGNPMTTARIIAFTAALLLFLDARFIQAGEISRSFEFRYVTNDPKADGETDFKGKTSVFTTEERVEFLKQYAEYASSYFGDPGLDREVVSLAEAMEALRSLKPRPLPSVRTRIPLDSWRWTGFREGKREEKAKALAAWEGIPAGAVREGFLSLPRGNTSIRRVFAPQAWRFTLRWTALPAENQRRIAFVLSNGDTAALTVGFAVNGMLFHTEGDREARTAAWKPVRDAERSGLETMPYQSGVSYTFAVEVDLVAGRYNLTVNGRLLSDFAPLRQKVTRIDAFTIEAVGGCALDDILGTGFSPAGDVRTPYAIRTFLDEDFSPGPDIRGWTGADYDDHTWGEGALPLVHGGERHAGEDLYLRKIVRIGTFLRAELSAETLDPGGEIWVNGEVAAVIGNRRPIRFDITRFLKPDAANLLAVRVRHFSSTHPVFHAPEDKNIGWFAGKMHLDLTANAFVEDMLVHAESVGDPAMVKASVGVRNTAPTPFTGAMTVNLYPWFPEESSTHAASLRLPVRLTAWGAATIDAAVPVPHARLWTSRTPNLYLAEVVLSDSAGKAIDDCADTFGIRTVSQDGGTFRVNGKPEMLNGAQIMGFRMPADRLALWNRCPPPEWLMREILMIRRMNGNLLRVHVHAWTYPEPEGGINDPRIAEMCDQMGVMLIWPTSAWIREGEAWGIDFDGYPKYMWQVYNHPSIVMWEASNHPNRFKLYGPSESNRFMERVYNAIHPADASRLISATSFIGHLHYGNDLGTLDYRGSPLIPSPAWTAPGVTRGNQDSVTGYGREWSTLRDWPPAYQRDFLQSPERAYFNFEHEESIGQPNWSLVRGKPWHLLPSYEWGYDEGSIGRRLTTAEWRASQAWQAFSAYESTKKQRLLDYDGFSWCCLHGGPNSGTYWKPLTDESCRAKLAFYANRMAFQPVLAGSANVDAAYGPHDMISPVVLNLGEARTVTVAIEVRNMKGKTVFSRKHGNVSLLGGRTSTALAPFAPGKLKPGYYAVEYKVME